MCAGEELPEARSRDGAKRERQTPKRFAELKGAVAIVSAEKLISAIATQGDFHVLARLARKIMRRQGGRIAKWLAKNARQLRQILGGVEIDDEILVRRPQVLGDFLG